MDLFSFRSRAWAVSASLVAGLVVGAGEDVAVANPNRPAAGSGTLVKLGSTSHGKVLVGPHGMTLYDFAPDGKNVSHCTGKCLKGWPPLKTSGPPRAGTGVVAGKLGQTSTHQVTYNGHPLYYYVNDQKRGDTRGEDLNADGGYWWLVNAKGKSVK